MNKQTLLHLIAIRSLERGLSERQLATLALGDPDAIRNWRRKSDPLFSRVMAVLEYLDIPVKIGKDFESTCLENTQADTLKPFVESVVPWWGEIAAGGGDRETDGLICQADTTSGDVVASPLFLDTNELIETELFAVTVRGQSMKPVYNDGDIIYMNPHDPLRHDPEQLIGRDCAVTLTEEHGDSAVFLKRLRWPDNQKTGCFNLESINQDWPVMENIPVQSVIPVRFVRRYLT